MRVSDVGDLRERLSILRRWVRERALAAPPGMAATTTNPARRGQSLILFRRSACPTSSTLPKTSERCSRPSASPRIEELFANIPPHLRLNRPLQVPEALSEIELTAHVQQLAGRNRPAGDAVCFLGGGAYDHFIPAVVDAIAGRSEYLHRLHALSGRGQPGQLAGVFRVSDAYLPVDRPGRGQRQPLRRRQRRGRGRADGAEHPTRSGTRFSSPRAFIPNIGRRSPPTSPISICTSRRCRRRTASSIPTI